jgi:glycosyltransferase involved in cell wall biosynthesis
MQKVLINSAIGYTGYGVVGWNIVRALHKLGVDVAVFPISLQKFTPLPKLDSQTEENLLHELTARSFDPKATCVKIWHQFDLAERIGVGKYIGFPFFEIDKFNEREIIHLNVPDELVVSSEWAKDIILQNNINKKINIVPLGVDLSVFNYEKFVMEKPKTNTDKYVFLSVGKWEIRKGHDILLEIFNKAFLPSDNVELWIAASSDKSCFSEKELFEWHSYYSSGPLKDKIKIIPRLKTQPEIAELMYLADCGIFMSRAEGWNLELLEMMSMNRPVIATNYSAHTEFCNEDNCSLVNIDSLETAYDGKWFLGQGNWAKIGEQQKDQAVEYMRKMYKNRISENKHGIKTAQKYSWENSANCLLRCI